MTRVSDFYDLLPSAEDLVAVVPCSASFACFLYYAEIAEDDGRNIWIDGVFEILAWAHTPCGPSLAKPNASVALVLHPENGPVWILFCPGRIFVDNWSSKGPVAYMKLLFGKTLPNELLAPSEIRDGREYVPELLPSFQ
jgi:hypothetical protein